MSNCRSVCLRMWCDEKGASTPRSRGSPGGERDTAAQPQRVEESRPEKAKAFPPGRRRSRGTRCAQHGGGGARGGGGIPRRQKGFPHWGQQAEGERATSASWSLRPWPPQPKEDSNRAPAGQRDVFIGSEASWHRRNQFNSYQEKRNHPSRYSDTLSANRCGSPASAPAKRRATGKPTDGACK
jgi:hypothetical protein